MVYGGGGARPDVWWRSATLFAFTATLYARAYFFEFAGGLRAEALSHPRET